MQTTNDIAYSRNEIGTEIARRYGLAIVAAIAALILRQILSPLLHDQNPYQTVWAALVFSAWYCGPGPSLVAALASMVGIWYWFLPPTHSFQLQDPGPQVSGMIGYLIFAGLIIALGEANRRSLDRSRRAEDELRDAHKELERSVRQRTAELNMANENLRDLSSRLQQMRDEDRRQIARELHDSVGQMLAALSMNMGIVQPQVSKLDAKGNRAVSENVALVGQISREIRTISHLLHPPLLEVAGLASALRWYVDGFSERSKIKIEVDIPADFLRLADEMEMAVFRMVQECLTNIHRHSGATSAAIRISQVDGHFLVEVRDTGKGIPVEKQLQLRSSGQTGLGFRGMRERLRQLGGNLDIQSDGKGTVVTPTLPGAQVASTGAGGSLEPRSGGSSSPCDAAA
jgi:signal transduction histidine kinase